MNWVTEVMRLRMVSVALLCGTSFLLPAVSAAQTMQWSYGGYASSIVITQVDPATGSSSTKYFNYTGQLKSNADIRTLGNITENIPGILTADTVHAFARSTSASVQGATTEAAVSHLNLTFGGHTIAAGFVEAIAGSHAAPKPDCTASPNAGGGSYVTEVTLDGSPVNIANSTFNQVFPIGTDGSKLVVNEYGHAAPSQFSRTVYLYGLHLFITGVGNVGIARAVASVNGTCQ